MKKHRKAQKHRSAALLASRDKKAGNEYGKYSFEVAVEYSLQIRSVLLYPKMPTFDGFNWSCNFAEYEANFVILFVLLLEIIVKT